VVRSGLYPPDELNNPRGRYDEGGAAAVAVLLRQRAKSAERMYLTGGHVVGARQWRMTRVAHGVVSLVGVHRADGWAPHVGCTCGSGNLGRAKMELGGQVQGD
jgi:hypothetical protein